MRSLNNHPQWHNQPLRLNDEQRRNPVIVIDEFFDCYHLQEVRKILWDWTVEVVSSHRSIASDPKERNNHLYFYEKIEMLVEAALIIQRMQYRKSRRRARRRHNSKA
jgi:hypothetical protein